MTRRAVVLFAGAGGSSVGLHDAGFEPVGYEYWRPAADTHRANGMVCHDHDLSDPAGDELISSCGLLWASPPCQPFSVLVDGEGEADDRDGFPWTLRIIGRLLPSVVIIENVKGITFAKHHAYFVSVLDDLRSLGYHVEWRVLNSADYGVPQTRERCFIIARRDGGPIVWPMPTHTEQAGMFTARWVTMAEALGWDGVGRYDRGEGMSERYGKLPDVIFSEVPAPTVFVSWCRNFQVILDRRQTSGAGEPTRLTIAELARLQDFPAGWRWCGTKTDQARMIGNAVPPTMAHVLSAANRPEEQP